MVKFLFDLLICSFFVSKNGVLEAKEVLSPDKGKYAAGLKAAQKAFRDAYEIFTAPDFVSKEGWEVEAKASDHEYVYSKHIPEGKLFALQCVLPGDVGTIFRDHWNDFEKGANWNDNLAFTRIVSRLDVRTEVIHYANRGTPFVQSRDFVVTRMYRKLSNGGYMIAGRSFNFSGISETNGTVRGELILGAGLFLKKVGDPKVTVVLYVMVVDLKGFLPKFIVNQFMAKLMLNDAAVNKKHIIEIMARM